MTPVRRIAAACAAIALVVALPTTATAKQDGKTKKKPTEPVVTTQPPADYIALAGTLSQPQYPNTVHEVTSVPMADGETLYVEVVRPDPAVYGDQKFPVILEASPYHGTLADRAGTRIFPDPLGADGKPIGLTGYFPPRGYAVVMVDLRGTGRSTGCLDHLGQKDAGDLKAIIEWAASQAWSTGRVGMTGHSYVGSTPVAAAAQRPQGLVTIVPSAGLASMYDHQFQKGVPYNLQWIGPMVAYPSLAIQRDMPPGSPALPVIGGGNTADNWENAPNPDAGCGTPNSAAFAGTGQVTGQYELWHAQRDWRDAAADVDIPVFMVHGVNDNAARIPAAEWFFARRFERPGDKVWVGQWDHGSTNGRCADLFGDRALHPTCRFDQWTYALHAWFDKHLQQRDVSTGPAVEAFLNGRPAVDLTAVLDPESIDDTKVLTDSAWRRPTVFTGLYPDARDMSLDFTSPDGTGTAAFGTTLNSPLLLNDIGSGSVTFRSEPVAQDTVFLGLARQTLHASVTNSQVVHLVSTLYREDDKGNREPMNTCAIQPQLRYGVTSVAPVVPNEEMALPMQCFTMAHWVPAGQRLVLQVATTSPHHATFGSEQRITVFTGADRSRMSLPTVAAPALFPDVKLRSEYPTFAVGPAQAPISGQVILPAPGGGNVSPGVTAAVFEFDMLAGYDNARTFIETTTLAADVDMYLQRQLPDGTWSGNIAAAETGSTEVETLTTGRKPAGRYRVLIHNWLGAPGPTQVSITFQNTDGIVGT